jgi:hypothetical protein
VRDVRTASAKNPVGSSESRPRDQGAFVSGNCLRAAAVARP